MTVNLEGSIGLVGQILDVPAASGARLVGALSSLTYYDETPEVELHLGGHSVVLMPGHSVQASGCRRVYTLA